MLYVICSYSRGLFSDAVRTLATSSNDHKENRDEEKGHRRKEGPRTTSVLIDHMDHPAADSAAHRVMHDKRLSFEVLSREPSIISKIRLPPGQKHLVDFRGVRLAAARGRVSKGVVGPVRTGPRVVPRRVIGRRFVEEVAGNSVGDLARVPAGRARAVLEDCHVQRVNMDTARVGVVGVVA